MQLQLQERSLRCLFLLAEYKTVHFRRTKQKFWVLLQLFQASPPTAHRTGLTWLCRQWSVGLRLQKAIAQLVSAHWVFHLWRARRCNRAASEHVGAIRLSAELETGPFQRLVNMLVGRTASTLYSYKYCPHIIELNVVSSNLLSQLSPLWDF